MYPADENSIEAIQIFEFEFESCLGGACIVQCTDFCVLKWQMDLPQQA